MKFEHIALIGVGVLALTQLSKATPVGGNVTTVQPIVATPTPDPPITNPVVAVQGLESWDRSAIQAELRRVSSEIVKYRHYVNPLGLSISRLKTSIGAKRVSGWGSSALEPYFANLYDLQKEYDYYQTLVQPLKDYKQELLRYY